MLACLYVVDWCENFKSIHLCYATLITLFMLDSARDAYVRCLEVVHSRCFWKYGTCTALIMPLYGVGDKVLTRLLIGWKLLVDLKLSVFTE